MTSSLSTPRTDERRLDPRFGRHHTDNASQRARATVSNSGVARPSQLRAIAAMRRPSQSREVPVASNVDAAWSQALGIGHTMGEVSGVNEANHSFSLVCHVGLKTTLVRVRVRDQAKHLGGGVSVAAYALGYYTGVRGLIRRSGEDHVLDTFFEQIERGASVGEHKNLTKPSS
jgi:hypothetical protein